MDKQKKMRIYECEHYEYGYDDFGKYALCHSRDCLSRECCIGCKLCQDLCPFYKKSKRYVEVEDSKSVQEIRSACKKRLEEQARAALEEAGREMRSAAKKMEFSKRLSEATARH